MSRFEKKNYGKVVIPMKLINRYSGLEREQILFTLIVQLHINGKINEQSLSALFNNLKQGKLDRRVNTYHCTYNDKWYNDESMLEILIDVISELNVLDIPMQKMIYYVNRYLNKPRNYCIDYIIGNFILPFINQSANSQHYGGYECTLSKLRLFNLTLPDICGYDNYEPSGYCCEDCDGDYEDYKNWRYKYYVLDQAITDIKSVFKTYFDNLRDESYYRNPNPVNLLN